MSVKDILLVDDSVDDVDLALRALGKLKLEESTFVARDGVEALEHLGYTAREGNESPEQPALMLLDLQMPRLDGFQVLTKLRADPQFKDMYIAILTSSSRNADKEKALRLGAQRYIVKPIDFNQFVEILRELTATLH